MTAAPVWKTRAAKAMVHFLPMESEVLPPAKLPKREMMLRLPMRTSVCTSVMLRSCCMNNTAPLITPTSGHQNTKSRGRTPFLVSKTIKKKKQRRTSLFIRRLRLTVSEKNVVQGRKEGAGHNVFSGSAAMIILRVRVHSLILIPLVSDRDRRKNRATVIFYRRKSHFSSPRIQTEEQSRTGSQKRISDNEFLLRNPADVGKGSRSETETRKLSSPLCVDQNW